MALGVDRYGLTVYCVLDPRLTLATVVIVAGVYITVDITRTSQLPAIVLRLLTVIVFLGYDVVLEQKIRMALSYH